MSSLRETIHFLLENGGMINLKWIERTEQEIHQDIQMLGEDSSSTRAYQGMNRLTVLKNDIKELCQEELLNQ